MEYINKLRELGINLKHISGNKKYMCPNCISTKKDKKAKDLSVSIQPDRVLYQCHNDGCGFKGVVFTSSNITTPKKTYKRPEIQQAKEDQQLLYDYWQKRGISKKTVDKFEIKLNTKGIMVFPYYKGGVLVNHKYRWHIDGKKKFSQDAEAEQVFYGMDLITDFSRLIICEGEPDVLTFAEIGIESVSVPQGATEDKMDCIDNCFEWLQLFDSYIICADNDEAGRKMINTLINRLDKAKCSISEYKQEGNDGIIEYKDANEVLTQCSYGKDFLEVIIESARPVPIPNLIELSDLDNSIMHLYEHGIEDNCSTGWKNLDEIFTIKTGHLMVVTGIPSRGKSLFTTNLLYNLSHNYGWRHLVASFEDTPETYVATLASMMAREAFFGKAKMDLQMLEACKEFIYYHFKRIDNAKSWNFDEIIEMAEYCKRRYGIKTLVIDPYSNLEIDNKENETTYIKQMLAKATSAARKLDILIIFVAHPSKTYNSSKEGNKEQVPTLRDISGSIHWRNFCHYGIVVDRIKENEELGRTTNIIVEKVKNIFLGKQTSGRTFFIFKNYALEEIPKEQSQRGLFGG